MIVKAPKKSFDNLNRVSEKQACPRWKLVKKFWQRVNTTSFELGSFASLITCSSCCYFDSLIWRAGRDDADAAADEKEDVYRGMRVTRVWQSELLCESYEFFAITGNKARELLVSTEIFSLNAVYFKILVFCCI